MFTRRLFGNACYYTSPIFDKFNIKHGFFTRHGGVSEGDFASLNVSTARLDRNGNLDDPKNVEKNYRLALCALGADAKNSVGTRQVHGNFVRTVGGNDGGRGILFDEPEGCDGLFLGEKTDKTMALCVKTADCVPILLASKDGSEICAVHAGWRGTVGDIVTVAAGKFTCEREDIVAAVGPCILECCYRVGKEVYDAACDLFSAKNMEHLVKNAFRFDRDDMFCDLAKINKLLLVKHGVPEENIDLAHICTSHHSDEFFSHRASGGHSGTFLSVISR